MSKPRDWALNWLLEHDSRAAELYEFLPEEVQALVRRHGARSAEELERLSWDYVQER